MLVDGKVCWRRVRISFIVLHSGGLWQLRFSGRISAALQEKRLSCLTFEGDSVSLAPDTLFAWSSASRQRKAERCCRWRGIISAQLLGAGCVSRSNRPVSFCPSTLGQIPRCRPCMRPRCTAAVQIWPRCRLSSKLIRRDFLCYFLSMTTGDVHVGEERTSEGLHWDKHSMINIYIYIYVTVGAAKGSFHLIIKHINSVPAQPVNENMKICRPPAAGCRFVRVGGG